MATPFDQGRSAARQGKSKRSNPFDHPDRQVGGSMSWEQKASEWDEGWESFDAAAEAVARSARASNAARARWRLEFNGKQVAFLTDEDRALLAGELARADLQVYTVVRMAKRDLERGHADTAIARLKVDADKLRCHDTPINQLIASH